MLVESACQRLNVESAKKKKQTQVPTSLTLLLVKRLGKKKLVLK